MLVSAVRDDNPVLYIDDRWLYTLEEEVPDEMFEVPLGKGRVRKEGSDVTIVAVSYLVREAMEAADVLSSEGISAEVIDPRTLKPLDIDLIVSSVKKTGRLVVADPDWPCCSFSEHVAATVSRRAFDILKCPVQCVTWGKRGDVLFASYIFEHSFAFLAGVGRFNGGVGWWRWI